MAVKDSGKRMVFESGMHRDTEEGKIDYTLALDGPMFWRYAEHMQAGADKYEKRNWMQATGQAEYDRFKASALRHFLQWYNGALDEDHAAAAIFNMNGAEYVADKMWDNAPEEEPVLKNEKSDWPAYDDYSTQTQYEKYLTRRDKGGNVVEGASDYC